MIGKGCGRKESWPHLRCTQPVLERLNKTTKALSVCGLWTEVCPRSLPTVGKEFFGLDRDISVCLSNTTTDDNKLALLNPSFIHRISSMYRNCAQQNVIILFGTIQARSCIREKRLLNSSLSSVCLSASMYQLRIYWLYSQQILYWLLLLTSVDKIQTLLKSDRTIGHFT